MVSATRFHALLLLPLALTFLYVLPFLSFSPPSASSYSSLRRVGGSALGAESAGREALRGYLLSLVGLGGGWATANPWRAAFIRGRLDWHDLVPDTFSVGVHGEAAAEALSRHLREEAKTELLELLQDVGGGGVAFPADASLGVGEGGAQARILAALRGGANGSRTLLALLRDGGAVAAAAAAAGVGADDVSAHAAPPPLWGPLAPLAGCSRVRDGCLLHATLRACAGSPLCGWCAASSTCLSRGGGGGVRCALAPGAAVDAAVAAALPRSAVAGGALLVFADRVPAPGGGGGNCTILLRETPLTVEISGNSKMVYHWATETLPGWVAAAAGARGGLGAVDRLLVYRGAWDDLLTLSHVFSRSCPVAAHAPVLVRVCEERAARGALGAAAQLALVDAISDAPLEVFGEGTSAAALGHTGAAVAAGMRLGLAEAAAALREVAAGGAGGAAWLAAVRAPPPPGAAAGELADEAAALAAALGAPLGDSYPALAAAACGERFRGEEGGGGSGAPPLVLVISRRNKRLLLNEAAIVRAALALGARALVVALEGMPLCAQVRLFRAAAVLVGMHGSGLINTMFMRRGSAVVQVVPFKLHGAAAFFQGTAQSAGVAYGELHAAAREDVIPHAHFLPKSKTLEEAFREGSACCGQQTYFSFFINQDVLLREHDIERALRDALKSAQPDLGGI
jgi:hypothetical protein